MVPRSIRLPERLFERYKELRAMEDPEAEWQKDFRVYLRRQVKRMEARQARDAERATVQGG